MKVVAFNGSPRANGNTSLLIKHAFKALEKEGIETELVQVGGQLIRGCTACMKCVANKNKRCVIDNDIINDCVEKMREADGIIIGSPTYFSDVTAETKALIDRVGAVSRANGCLFQRKPGAAVIAVRRGGEIHAFDTINHFFLIQDMIIPGSIYWNMGIGREIGQVDEDEEGVRTMKRLGENMAWLLKKLHAAS